MDVPSGLRERKKHRTRQQIADTALALFAQRGFEQVPVAEIARQAEVSEATVFNYFRTKEDLVFTGLSDYGAELLAAIRHRPPGQPLLDGFREFLFAPRGLLAERPEVRPQQLATLAKVITDSPALQARERQISDESTRQLALLLGAEAGADPADIEHWVVANALIGVHRALVQYVRQAVLAGRSQSLADEIVDQGERALAALEHGLRTYGARS